MEEFYKTYIKSKTWGELEDNIKENLTPSDILKLSESMDIVKKFTGLDMRQDFLLGILKAVIKYNGY